MRGNIAQLMQQAQKMQEDMQRAQEELAALEVVGNAGGGMVSVTLGGRMDCRKVRLDPSVLADPEMAEDQKSDEGTQVEQHFYRHSGPSGQAIRSVDRIP